MNKKKNISQFVLIIDKKNNSHQLWIKENDWIIINSNADSDYYTIGHTNDNVNGEFIHIEINNREIRIHNDPFGAIPIYNYESEDYFAITNSLAKLAEFITINCEIKEKELYEYFIFGYQVNGNQSYYKNIKSFQTHFTFNYNLLNKSFSQLVSENTIYDSINLDNDAKEIDSSILLKEEVEVGLNSLEGKSAILLSGGNDSLLGTLLYHSIYPDKMIHTATFGLADSKDILVAKERAKIIFKSEHIEFLINDIKPSNEQFINHSIAQNGFGTLSSIYYSLFFRNLINYGFKNTVFSDHFECTRKEIPDLTYLKTRYTTPELVVNRYINNNTLYKYYLDEALDGIKIYYNENACFKFYYQDRNIRGQAWKMALCNEFGLVKYNLSNHIKFLQHNYMDVNSFHKFTYPQLIKAFTNQSNISENELKYTRAFVKNIPIAPQQIIYDNAVFFIDILNSEISMDIKSHFNIDLIINDIRLKTIPESGEWLILRLLNISIFNLFLNSKLR